MKPRKLSNGTLAYPTRGNPPEAPFGYIQVEGRPFQFTPILEPCIHRESKLPDCRGCGKSIRTVCNYELDDKVIGLITAEVCKGCGSNPGIYWVDDE